MSTTSTESGCGINDLPVNRSQLVVIITENIMSQYINVTNYKKSYHWLNKILNEYVTRFYPSMRDGDYIVSDLFSDCATSVACEVFGDLKPSPDWPKIFSFWESMNKLIYQRTQVEKDTYTDDLDYPPTDLYCFSLSDALHDLISGKLTPEILDHFVIIFMLDKQIPIEYHNTVKSYIIHDLHDNGVKIPFNA